MGWDPLVFDIMVITMADQIMHYKVNVKGPSMSFFVSVVYGNNNILCRRTLWNDLRQFNFVVNNSSWLLIGDFNTILHTEKK